MPPPTVAVDAPEFCMAIFIIAAGAHIILVGAPINLVGAHIILVAIAVFLVAIAVFLVAVAALFAGEAMFLVAIAKRCANIAILLTGGRIFALTRVKRNCLKMRGVGVNDGSTLSAASQPDRLRRRPDRVGRPVWVEPLYPVCEL